MRQYVIATVAATALACASTQDRDLEGFLGTVPNAANEAAEQFLHHTPIDENTAPPSGLTGYWPIVNILGMPAYQERKPVTIWSVRTSTMPTYDSGALDLNPNDPPLDLTDAYHKLEKNDGKVKCEIMDKGELKSCL